MSWVHMQSTMSCLGALRLTRSLQRMRSSSSLAQFGRVWRPSEIQLSVLLPEIWRRLSWGGGRECEGCDVAMVVYGNAE